MYVYIVHARHGGSGGRKGGGGRGGGASNPLVGEW